MNLVLSSDNHSLINIEATVTSVMNTQMALGMKETGVLIRLRLNQVELNFLSTMMMNPLKMLT